MCGWVGDEDWDGGFFIGGVGWDGGSWVGGRFNGWDFGGFELGELETGCYILLLLALPLLFFLLV